MMKEAITLDEFGLRLTKYLIDDYMIKRRFDISTNSITKCKYYLLRIKLSITDYLITDGPVILNISNFKLY